MKCQKFRKYLASPLHGFALLEAALALGVFGIIAASRLALVRTQRVALTAEKTRKALENATQSLVAYARVYNRLPKPAETLDGVESKRPHLLVGLLPYRTLCLDESSVKDGHGRLLTYAVTPELTSLPTTSALDLLAPEDEPRGMAAIPNRNTLQIIDAKGQRVCPFVDPEADFCAFFVVSTASDEQLARALSLQVGSLLCSCPAPSPSFQIRWLSRNHLLSLIP